VAVNLPAAVPGVRVPIRTCIGCRHREAVAELLRVTADPSQTAGQVRLVVIRPDPLRRAPGRGAWLHPSVECVALAERRRAFGRALRLSAPVDSAPVREFVERLAAYDPDRLPPEQGVGETHESETKTMSTR
jgi:uncharacterized protein